jgi:hypothetical protein
MSEDKVFGGLMALIVAAVAVCVWMGIRSDNDYAAWCQSKGGHVSTSTSYGSGVGVSSKGGVTPVVTSSTTYYCLTSDGRIIDIR